jgi:HSP20 family protein
MTLPVRRRGWTRGPLAEFDDLFDRMSSLLESTVGGFAPTAERVAWAPLADLSETEDAYVIQAELPGIRREDVDVEVGEREMSISGEYKETVRQGTLRHSTRRTGRFEYRTALPGPVNAEQVTAQLADGVLTVRVPKAEGARVRHIEIESGG